MSHILFPHEHSVDQLLGTIGRPLPHVDARVVRDDGSDAEGDEVGELHVRAATASRAAWQSGRFTPLVDADGWLATGDLASTHDGYTILHDRKGFRIKTGGYAVYPIEVEAVLCEHDGVAEAAVVGVPDPALGEVVVAAVRPTPHRPVEVDELTRFVLERLARYKVPRYMELRPELPKGATGKLHKRVLRDELAVTWARQRGTGAGGRFAASEECDSSR
jgi:acyl-CoA synthetase (AMP-forming)/AMP-acid ligase II